MRNTHRWEKVVDLDGKTSTRMVYEDTYGRKCVRYRKAWHLLGVEADASGKRVNRIRGEA